MSSNPLRQYFRRPAIYLKLPSKCNHYTPEVVEPTESGELPVYPMTAIDEITLKTPDALFNGAAIVDIIKSCVPNIKNPWMINSIDLDAVLISIRASSSGEQFEIETACPACNEVNRFAINLVAILASISSIGYDQELQISDLSIKFKPLTYKEMNEASINQFEVQKILSTLGSLENVPDRNEKSKQALKAITELTMDVLSKSIEYIKTPTITVTETEYILDFIKNCDRKIYVSLRDHNAELRSSTAIKPFDIKCPDCGNEYKQPFTVNYSDFFE